MADIDFKDEALDQSVRKRAEYDDSTPSDLVLQIPKRAGGAITIPLLKNARANEEREGYQDNTLMRIKPVAELCHDAPVRSGGMVTNTGRGVALVRPGYLYVFRCHTLWRELEIGPDGRMSDIDLASYRSADDGRGSDVRRVSEGAWSTDLLIPAFLQSRAVMHEYRVVYSEVQWSWSRIRALETDVSAFNKRTTSVGPAYAAVQPDTPQAFLTFSNGFPAQRVESVPPLRLRDLGIELMLEQPLDFTPAYEQPAPNALCQRLAQRLASLNEDGDESPDLDLSSKAADDALVDLRAQKGMVCFAIPDVLFEVRHSLAQIHLALQYLNAIDLSLKKQPQVHSAMLIRQALFDPRPNGSNPLTSYRDAVDRDKLNGVLLTGEREYAANIITAHVKKLTSFMEYGQLDAVLDDYLTQDGVGVCEAYSLCADQLNLFQLVPGVLAAQGLADNTHALNAINRWITSHGWLEAWSPSGQSESTGTGDSPYAHLQRLAADQTEITDEHLNYLHLQSLVQLEKQVQQAQRDARPADQKVKDAGQVGKLVSDVLGEWSSAMLALSQRLIDEGEVTAVHLPRILQGAATAAILSDPNLDGINVMRRGEVDLTRQHIVGVYGDGLNYGLTDFDRTTGVLKRGRDYLYADLLNKSSDTVGSTSTQRAAEQIEGSIKKVSVDAWVFTVPAGNPAARKLSLVKVDLAKKVGAVVDGPGVSTGLVALAVFNLFIESKALIRTIDGNEQSSPHAAKAFGALSDMIAASMKFKVVSVQLSGAELTSVSKFYRISNQLLFDMKRVPLIGTRLIRAGAHTLVRTVGAVSFVAGVVTVGTSAWDMRISLSRGDHDSAQGHAIAMVGSSIFLAAPLMAGLLAIPGWGWAVLGISMAVGGSLFAGQATDDAFERLLKNGPLGAHPLTYDPMPTDADYYGQLLTLLTPLQATAQRYRDVEPDPALNHSNPQYAPQPDDYVVTLTSPLISQFRHKVECRTGDPTRSFSIAVQEVAYTESQTMTGNAAIGTVQQATLSNITPLTQITARQSLPAQNAIRFLVRRNLKNSSFDSFSYSQTVSTTIRIAVQAAIGSEAGTMIYPTPLLESFIPYNPGENGLAPPKERSYLNPYSNSSVPYWSITEVDV